MMRVLWLVVVVLAGVQGTKLQQSVAASDTDQVCAVFGAEKKKICAEEKWINSTLDHFRFTTPTKRWKHRYLINTDSWGKPSGEEESLKLPDGCKGPILFYTGNEGPIDAFWGSNGFMVNHLAPKWGAMLLFGEERYYGKSQPFGNASLTPSNAVFLSTEQVLGDYAELLTYIKDTHNASSCPVVAFGGSYGGTLTTYFRRMYPALTVGGLAASAPVGYYSNSGWKTHGVNTYTWIDIVQRVFSTTQHGGPACFERLKSIVAAVAAAASTPTGRVSIASRLHVCDPSVLGKDPTNFLIDALETLPQLDYPYAIGSIPAWPINATCEAVMMSDDVGGGFDPIAVAANITDMYYGYDGVHCLTGEGQGGIPGGGPGPASWGSWGYQSCTETLHQFSSSTLGHGFRNFTFDMDNVKEACSKFYAAEPNPWWAETHFGGYAIGDGLAGVTHVIWSNGGLDPWHGGGFLRPNARGNTDNLHWFFMPQGAHHFDLRGPHPSDPANVTATRAAEEAIIKSWIEGAS